MLFDQGEYTKVAEFKPLQWSPIHTYIALSTTFEATNSRRIIYGGFPPSSPINGVLASMKLYDLINAPHCLRGEGGIITLHPMNVEACRRRAMADAASSSLVIIVVRWRWRRWRRRRSRIVVFSAGVDDDADDASSSSPSSSSSAAAAAAAE